MKKLKLISLVPVLFLSSCGQINPVGTYQFRLGKTDDSHIEVTAKITDEAYTIEGMKKMSLTADLGDELSINKLIEEYLGEDSEIGKFLIEKIASMNKELPMYYKVNETTNPKYGNYVDIGSDALSEIINELANSNEQIKKFIEDYGIDINDFTFTPEMTKYIFTTYVNSKNLTFQIPVSLQDLQMQLFWYGPNCPGYLTDILDLVFVLKGMSLPRVDDNYFERMPKVEGERFGNHPLVVKDEAGNIIKSQVQEVNETFEKEFSDTYLYSDSSCTDKIGAFATRVIEGKYQLRYYAYDDAAIKEHISGFVKSNKDESKNPIQFSIDSNNLTNVVHNGQTGKDEGFADENSQNFTFNSLMNEPSFTFRDFHTVYVSLGKI